MIPTSHRSLRPSGFTLLEVLVAMGILTAGLLAIMAIFPLTLRAQRDAELLTVAASLAQMKAEEIRRDDDVNGRLVAQIKNLTQATAPIVFPHEPRLAYSFSGRSLLYPPSATGDDPRAESGVARVIIRYAPTFRPDQEVIYELRFDK